jgi:uncharacterized protein YbcV (DUF1398 family)
MYCLETTTLSKRACVCVYTVHMRTDTQRAWLHSDAAVSVKGTQQLLPLHSYINCI